MRKILLIHLLLAMLISTGCAGETVFVRAIPPSPIPPGEWSVGKWAGSVPDEAWPDDSRAVSLEDEEQPDEYLSTPGRVLSGTVQVLRYVVSRPAHSNCQFRPSCGEYALDSIKKYGIFYGYLMAGDRLSRCSKTARFKNYRKKKIGEFYYSEDDADGGKEKKIYESFRLLDPPEDHYLPVKYEPLYILQQSDEGDLTRDEIKAGKTAKEKMAARRKRFIELSAPKGAPPFAAALEGRPEEEHKLFNFGLSLMKNEELYRAITEFYRFASYYSESPLAGEAHALIGDCYLLAGKWNFAEKAYEKARVKLTDNGHLYLEIRIAAAAYFLDNFDEVKKRSEIIFAAKNPGLAEAARYLMYLSDIRKRALDKAADELGRLESDYPNARKQWMLEVTPEDVRSGEAMYGRSATIASVMSAVVPGLGQMYAGQTGDGFNALVAVGGLGTAGYFSFRDHSQVPGYIFSGLALSFYFANIYNAADAANTYNSNVVKDFYKRMREGSFFDSLILSPDAEGGVFAGLGYSF
jgi:hypothetical protein